MSGGAFNYLHIQADCVRRSMLDVIEHARKESLVEPQLAGIVKKLEEFQKKTEEVIPLLHDYEWYASGDIGLSELLRRI
jgi:hypothetical protein